MSHTPPTAFQPIPIPLNADPEELRRSLDEAIRIINLLGAGKSGNSLEVTLGAGGTTTTVTTPLIGYFSAFLWDPLTANAQAELVTGVPLATTTNRLIGSAVFTHQNNAQTDRTFRVVVLG